MKQQLEAASEDAGKRVTEQLEQRLKQQSEAAETRVAELEQCMKQQGEAAETRVAELENRLKQQSEAAETRVAELDEHMGQQLGELTQLISCPTDMFSYVDNEAPGEDSDK